MSLSDVLDTAFRLLRMRIRQIATILVVVVVPIDLLSALGTRSLLGGRGVASLLTPATTSPTTTTSGASPASLVASLLGIVVLPIAAGAIAAIVEGAYRGDEPTAAAALRRAGRRVLPLLVATVCVHLLELVGFVFAVLPGMVVMALSVAVAPVIVLERLGPFRGMRRSWGLCGSRLWGVLGTVLVAGFVATVCSSIVALPLQIAGVLIGTRAGWPLIFVGAVLSSVFSVAFSGSVASLVYVDCRIRREGFDLELLAGRLAARPLAPTVG